jgi:hypothetical protein
MFRKLNIFLSLILISALTLTPAQSTSPDYVVLESITAINSTILIGEDVEYELVVSAPKDFAWDPKGSNADGKLMILLCRKDIYSNDSKICDFQNQMSKYRISNIDSVTEEIVGNFKYYQFRVFGKILVEEKDDYFPFLIRIPNADISDPEWTSLFYYFESQIKDSYENIINLTNVDFSQSIITVTDFLEENNPDPVQDPEPDPEVEEVIAEEPPVVVVPPPAPPAGGGSQRGSSQPAPSLTNNEVLEQKFVALPLSGNQTWKPMQQIKGEFENWSVGKKNSINGVNPRFTKTNLSMMTFRTTGDSVSVRYMGGKKRGSFSIYVNGKFVERVEAKTKKKRQLVKTWDGLGEGRHYIDIVAELKPGDSLAINGVQRQRLN